MFGFFKKKKINTENVKNFDAAIRVIKTYIELSDWANALKAIEEISFKEQESFNSSLNNLKTDDSIEDKHKEKIINEEKKKYEKKKLKIEKIRTRYERKKTTYTEKLEKQLFELRFKKIKDEVNKLLGKKEALESMNLLKAFLEENKDKSIVINFYNNQKKKVQKVIDKQRKLEQEKIKQSTQYEAMCLIGDIGKTEEAVEAAEGSFFHRLKDRFSSYKTIKEGKESKKLLDEINILLDENDKIKQEIAEKKLENIHKGLVKEISKDGMIGYELYGKILGANKISGDAFGIEETKDKYKFFIGDATGHGIRAGFIITLLNKLFNINYEKDLSDLIFDLNNQLKQKLESRNFVTGIFFEIDKRTYEVNYVGVGHEPILVYRRNINIVEKIVPGGIAMGIIKMKDKNLVKIKNLRLKDGDILLCYSDGLVELKSINGEFYGIDKLEESFKLIASRETNVEKIYEYLINDAKLYRGGTQFDDDLTMILVKRDSENDLIVNGDKYVEKMKVKEGLNSSDIKNLTGKTRKEALKEMVAIKKKKETKTIIGNLETLYYTGEMLKLKEEATRYIKEGYIDKKINYYLKKAIDNETQYKVNLKNQKMQAKYNVLNELFKKGDYVTVMKEIEEIVSKDGNI